VSLMWVYPGLEALPVSARALAARTVVGDCSKDKAHVSHSAASRGHLPGHCELKEFHSTSCCLRDSLSIGVSDVLLVII
jgi:hypothetical protein